VGRGIGHALGVGALAVVGLICLAIDDFLREPLEWLFWAVVAVAWCLGPWAIAALIRRTCGR
jgi:hypothetical protein